MDASAAASRIRENVTTTTTKSTTPPLPPESTSYGFVTYIVFFIFFLIALLLIVYLYQVNTRNLPAVPVITDFGVTINTFNYDRQVVFQAQTFNGGTGGTFKAVQSGAMTLVDCDIVVGEGSTGWILHPVNLATQNIVSIRNAYTNTFAIYFVDASGNPINGGSILDSGSDLQPRFFDPKTNPTTLVGEPLGWFMIANLPRRINPVTKLPDAAVTFQALNTVTPTYIAIGPQAPSGPTDFLMTLQPAPASVQAQFALSTGGAACVTAPIGTGV